MSTAPSLPVLKARGIKLWAEGETLRYRAPAGTVTPDLLASLKVAKPELLRTLKLESVAAEACAGLCNVTPADVLKTLTPEDVADIQAMGNPLPFLRSYACALSATRWRQIGVAPPGWTHAAHCDLCGPVYLWRSVKVAGCPWCWNRLHGVKIPRPHGAAA